MMLRLITVVLLALLMSACAQQNIVELKEPTVQNQLMDVDNDGVIKARDLCGQTTAGADVDNYGCAKKIAEALDITLELNFQHNSAILGDGDVQRISALAKYLKINSSMTAALGGHTSKVGDDEYNMKLGLARAQAVRDVLVNDFGIEAERIDIASYGYRRLKRQGEGERTDAYNRRVEVDSNSTETEIDTMKWNIYTPGQ